MTKRLLSGLLALLMVFTLAFGLVGCSSAGVESALDQAISRVEEVEAELEAEAAGQPGAEATPEAAPTVPPQSEPAQSEPAPTPAPGSSAEPQEPEEPAEPEEPDEPDEPALLDPEGTYTTKEDVALYIHQYGELPVNFITKQEAEDLGWSGGGLEKYAPGMCIGGNRFGNREGLLPKAEGRVYTECDIDTLGAAKRGAKRIVFSNDGLIYYTDDHYESFELLYGEE